MCENCSAGWNEVEQIGSHFLIPTFQSFLTPQNPENVRSHSSNYWKYNPSIVNPVAKMRPYPAVHHCKPITPPPLLHLGGELKRVKRSRLIWFCLWLVKVVHVTVWRLVMDYSRIDVGFFPGLVFQFVLKAAFKAVVPSPISANVTLVGLLLTALSNACVMSTDSVRMRHIWMSVTAVRTTQR